MGFSGGVHASTSPRVFLLVSVAPRRREAREIPHPAAPKEAGSRSGLLGGGPCTVEVPAGRV